MVCTLRDDFRTSDIETVSEIGLVDEGEASAMYSELTTLL